MAESSQSIVQEAIDVAIGERGKSESRSPLTWTASW